MPKKKIVKKRAAKKVAKTASKKKPTKRPAKKKAAPKKRAAQPKQFKLSGKELKFCRLMANGDLSQGKCYKRAFACATDSIGSACATRLLKKAKINAEIKRLRNLTETQETLSRQRKREICNDIAEGYIEGTAQARIQAVKVDNEMTGDNAPIKIKGELTLKGVWDKVQDTTGLPGKR